MGGNQITKFFEKKRTKEFGMVGPTLSNPDVIIEEASEAKDGNAERGSSFLFIKTFNRNGEKVKFYASITVKQDGMEVSVSSHYMNKNKVKRALQESGVLYIREALLSNSSEWRLAEHRDDVPDLLPTQESNASENKDTHSFRNNSELSEKIADAEANTDINPTEAQKEAGNYKKGHVRVGTFDISIEQPKGSVRSGVDANGKKWETTMQNTYGYIRGTEGVDGDHIDVFLSDDIDGWNGRKAFVVDQYNEDGSFDEHKVMLGFNEAADAETAYFANYDKNWAKKHKTVVTAVNLEDFEKWIGSSHRKTKAFAEYKSVKTEDVPQKAESSVSGNGYTIEPAQYTTKRGKVLDMHLVKFQSELRKEVQKHTAMFAKEMKGWWDREKRGFMMRSEEDARRLVDYATDAQSQPPLSLSDLSKVNDGDVQFAESPQAKIQKQEEKQEYTPVWQYSVSVDKETGYTTLKRDDVSGSIPIGDGRFNYTANSPEEMLEIVRNPKNFTGSRRSFCRPPS